MCLQTHVCIQVRTNICLHGHILCPHYICLRMPAHAACFIPYERMLRYDTLLNGSLKIELVFLDFLLEVWNSKC